MENNYNTEYIVTVYWYCNTQNMSLKQNILNFETARLHAVNTDTSYLFVK